jgi:hypothetical protein
MMRFFQIFTTFIVILFDSAYYSLFYVVTKSNFIFNRRQNFLCHLNAVYSVSLGNTTFLCRQFNLNYIQLFCIIELRFYYSHRKL